MVSGLPLTALIHLQVIFVGGIYKTGVQFQSATWEYTVLSEFKGLDPLPSSLQRCGRSSVTVLWALLPPCLSLQREGHFCSMWKFPGQEAMALQQQRWILKLQDYKRTPLCVLSSACLCFSFLFLLVPIFTAQSENAAWKDLLVRLINHINRTTAHSCASYVLPNPEEIISFIVTIDLKSYHNNFLAHSYDVS